MMRRTHYLIIAMFVFVAAGMSYAWENNTGDYQWLTYENWSNPDELKMENDPGNEGSIRISIEQDQVFEDYLPVICAASDDPENVWCLTERLRMPENEDEMGALKVLPGAFLEITRQLYFVDEDNFDPDYPGGGLGILTIFGEARIDETLILHRENNDTPAPAGRAYIYAVDGKVTFTDDIKIDLTVPQDVSDQGGYKEVQIDVSNGIMEIQRDYTGPDTGVSYVQDWIDEGILTAFDYYNVPGRLIVSEWDGDAFFITAKTYYAFAKEPADDAVQVPLDTDLSWHVPTEELGGAHSYEVYLSDDPTFANTTPVVIDASTDPNTAPDADGRITLDLATDLLPDVEYYWRVDVLDANEANPDDITVYTGSVDSFHSFTYREEVISPADLEDEVDPVNVTLEWTNNYTNTDYYEVYLSDDRSLVENGDPSVKIDDVTGNTKDTGRLEYNEIYYWRVDAVIGGQSFANVVWSFETIEPVCNGGDRLPGDENGDCRVNIEDLAIQASGWLECGYEPIDACDYYYNP